MQILFQEHTVGPKSCIFKNLANGANVPDPGTMVGMAGVETTGCLSLKATIAADHHNKEDYCLLTTSVGQVSQTRKNAKHCIRERNLMSL